MTAESKLTRLKVLLQITDTSDDAILSEYLNMAGEEILNWLYSNIGEVPEETPVPPRYENIQIQACVTGFNLIGAENEATHSENGISRTFKYSDMIAYIHSNVYPYVGIPG